MSFGKNIVSGSRLNSKNILDDNSMSKKSDLINVNKNQLFNIDLENNNSISCLEVNGRFVVSIDRKKFRETNVGDLNRIVKMFVEEYYNKVNNISYLRTYGNKHGENFHVGVFIHNVYHYSGGRYLGFLICMALTKYMKVTMVTDYMPKHFMSNFNDYPDINNFDVIQDFNYGSKVEENKFDFVIGIPNEPAMYAQLYGEKFGIPSFTMLFETPNYIQKHRGGADSHESYWSDLKKHLPKFDNIISISNETTNHTKEWLNNDGNFSTVYPPINDHIANKIYNDDSIKEEERSVIFIGRFVDHKNPLNILEKVICMKNPPDKIYLIGKVGGISGIRISKLINNDKGVIVEDHLGCDDKKKFELIKRSSVLIFPTIFEGFGMPPTEAFYFNKEVIAYDIPVLREVYGELIHYVEMNKEREKREINFVKVLDDVINKNKLKITKHNKKDFVSKWSSLDSCANNLMHVMMPLKLSVGIIVFNGEEYLKQAIDSVYNLANQIIIVEGAVEKMMFAANEDGSSTDNTVNIIKDYNDCDKKITFIQGKWKNKNEMQNVIAGYVDGDIYMKLDSDEVWLEQDIIKVLNMFRLDRHLMMVRPAFYHFWKNFSQITVGSQWDSKPVRFWRWFNGFRHDEEDKFGFNYFIDSSGNKVSEPRYKTIQTEDVHVYHCGYVKPVNKIKQKISYYKNRGIEKKVKDTYTNWQPGQNTQPTHGGGVVREFKNHLPMSLQQKINYGEK
ncbi:MAG: glycosyltransferase [Candidatus Lokiarchaeota archaeon]|nr:glycosyltransferase [Candidatus Lokiarchaeota archaeon]